MINNKKFKYLIYFENCFKYNNLLSFTYLFIII